MNRLSAVLQVAIALPRDFALMVLMYLPGRSGILLRRHYYSRRLKRCGVNLTVMPGVQLHGLQWIELGDNVMIRENAIIRTGAPNRGAEERRSIRVLAVNQGCTPGIVSISDNSRIAFGALLLGQGGILIGRDCGVGPGAVILSESFHHSGHDPAITYKYSEGAAPEEQGVLQGSVVMEDATGIASQAVLLPGARLERGAWVGPHGVVRVAGVVPAGSIVKGDPASPVFRRNVPRSAP
jgi:acetyltransferase-like isoleucine patch superfamily enzyme